MRRFAMMPFPPETVRYLATIFVILGFLGVVYLRRTSFKSKIIYLILLALLLVATVAVWYAMASTHILTELEIYAAGRPVKVLVDIFGVPYVGGTFIYESGPYAMQRSSGFSFYRLEGSNWAEINTECRDCVFRECVNGQIIEKIQPPGGPCVQLSSMPYIWNQTVFVSETRDCGGKPYSTYVQTQAGPGRYKIELCYGKAFNFDWEMPRCSPLQNVEPSCSEAYFWIR